jgi:membrane protease YdiL (CAAX protease family)
MLETFVKNRQFIITGLVVLFSLGFSIFFPRSDSFSPVLQSFIVSSIFFLVIPVLYCKIILKESLKNIGWQKGNVSAGVLTGIAAVILGSAIVAGLVFTFPQFREQYIFPAIVEKSFVWFILYELVLVALVALSYEVFFRGFVQILWLQAFGMRAIVIQTLLFLGLLFLDNSVSWQMAPLIIFSPLAGFIAYRSQSIRYSLAFSWLFIFLTDVFFLVLR